VTASPPENDKGAEKRRSARLLHAVPIIVTGTDALGQSFKETTSTVMVSCTGCKYQSTHYVPKNSVLTVEIARASRPRSRRILQARVVWVQRPSSYRDHFHIAVEFDVPGNVWGITSPPENWFAHPEDVELEIPVTEPIDLNSLRSEMSGKSRSAPYSGSFTSSVETIERPASKLASVGTRPHMMAATTLVAEIPQTIGKPEKYAVVVPQKEVPSTNSNREITVQSVVKEALAKELGLFRAQIEIQIKEAVSEAIKTSLDQTTALAIEQIVKQSSASAAVIVEQAQKAGQDLAEKFDERIQAATDAVSTQIPKPRAARKSSKRKTKDEVAPEA